METFTRKTDLGLKELTEIVADDGRDIDHKIPGYKATTEIGAMLFCSEKVEAAQAEIFLAKMLNDPAYSEVTRSLAFYFLNHPSTVIAHKDTPRAIENFRNNPENAEIVSCTDKLHDKNTAK